MGKNRIAEFAAKAGYKIPELAEMIGMRPPTLRCYTRHEREPREELAEMIALKLGCSAAEIMGLQAVGNDEPTKRIPLYGNAAAGFGDDTTDVTQPVDYIEPHPSCANSPTAYAVFINGDSMEPRFRSREIVYAKPGSPARRGDDVVVQLHKARGEHTAIVKRFVKRDDKVLTLHQLNPDKVIQLDMESVEAISVIVGTTIF